MLNRKLVQEVHMPPIPMVKRQLLEVAPKGRPLYDLTQAVPNYPCFPEITEPVSSPKVIESLSFYTDIEGLPELRATLHAAHPMRHSFAPEQIVVTAGANNGFFQTLVTMRNPGMKVCLLEPYYFNHKMALQMLDIDSVSYRLSEDEGFRFDPHDLAKFLAEERCNAVVLVTPNNPTGALYSEASVLELLELCAGRGISVILDETYLFFAAEQYSDHRFERYLDSCLVLVGSFSKIFSLTGYRVGYVVGPKKFIEQFLKVQDTALICAPALAQQMAVIGLKTAMPSASAKVAEMRVSARTIQETAATLSRFKVLTVGAYFAYLKHPMEGHSSLDAAKALSVATGIMTLPGEIFGDAQAQYLRLSFCNLSPDHLKSALAALSLFDRAGSRP